MVYAAIVIYGLIMAGASFVGIAKDTIEQDQLWFAEPLLSAYSEIKIIILDIKRWNCIGGKSNEKL